MIRFQNKVVVITGGAAGIGKAAVEKFTREGAAVAEYQERIFDSILHLPLVGL